MALSDRVEVSLPDRAPLFFDQYRIGFQDLNAAKHLSNEKYLMLSEEIFQNYAQFLGPSDDLGCLWGLGSFIASAKVQFVGQGFFGDELTMKLWMTEYSNSSFRVIVQIVCDERELGRVQVDRVFFDATTQSTKPCPKGFVEYFNTHCI